MARPMPRPAPVTITTAPSRAATSRLPLIRRLRRGPIATAPLHRVHRRHVQYATRRATGASERDRQSCVDGVLLIYMVAASCARLTLDCRLAGQHQRPLGVDAIGAQRD